MKKVILLLAAFLFIQPVMAKNVKVEALQDFSTLNPPKTWKVKILESFVADNGIAVSKNMILEGKIESVTSAKRLKRNATFTFIPTKYYNPSEGTTRVVKRDFEGKYSSFSELDKKTIVKKGAMTAGNFLIGSFVSPTVGLVEGVVKNEEGNRAKSAVVGAYENTPLSYANKGKELEFKRGQVFTMSFKLRGEEPENLPNYSYEIVE